MEKNDIIKDQADNSWPLMEDYIGYKDSSFIFSTRDIKNKLGLSQGETKKLLKFWESEGKLTQISSNKWSPSE